MTRKRYLFKQISFLISFIQGISSFFRILVSQNLVNRSMIVPFSLISFCTFEAYLSTSSQMMVFGGRTEGVRKFDCFQIFHIPWNTRSARVPRDANFPVPRDNYRIKQDRHCTTWDQLRVRTISEVFRVSALMITFSFMFTFSNKNISSEHISTSLFMSSRNGMYDKTTCGSFEANSFFNLITESFVNCKPLFSRVKYLGKMSNCHHTCFNRWNHHVHNLSAVRDGVGRKNST